MSRNNINNFLHIRGSDEKLQQEEAFLDHQLFTQCKNQ